MAYKTTRRIGFPSEFIVIWKGRVLNESKDFDQEFVDVIESLGFPAGKNIPIKPNDIYEIPSKMRQIKVANTTTNLPECVVHKDLSPWVSSNNQSLENQFIYGNSVLIGYDEIDGLLDLLLGLGFLLEPLDHYYQKLGRRFTLKINDMRIHAVRTGTAKRLLETEIGRDFILSNLTYREAFADEQFHNEDKSDYVGPTLIGRHILEGECTSTNFRPGTQDMPFPSFNANKTRFLLMAYSKEDLFAFAQELNLDVKPVNLNSSIRQRSIPKSVQLFVGKEILADVLIVEIMNNLNLITLFLYRGEVAIHREISNYYVNLVIGRNQIKWEAKWQIIYSLKLIILADCSLCNDFSQNFQICLSFNSEGAQHACPTRNRSATPLPTLR